jgi:hypothetical protein
MKDGGTRTYLARRSGVGIEFKSPCAGHAFFHGESTTPPRHVIISVGNCGLQGP